MTLLVCLQTPPEEQPQPALAASANATFADAVQAGLAQMLTALDAAGIHERPPQVRLFCKQQQSVYYMPCCKLLSRGSVS